MFVAFVILHIENIKNGTKSTIGNKRANIKYTHFVYKQNIAQYQNRICVFYKAHYCSVWQLHIQ
jgi:hypothetical protein